MVFLAIFVVIILVPWLYESRAFSRSVDRALAEPRGCYRCNGRGCRDCG